MSAKPIFLLSMPLSAKICSLWHISLTNFSKWQIQPKMWAYILKVHIARVYNAKYKGNDPLLSSRLNCKRVQFKGICLYLIEIVRKCCFANFWRFNILYIPFEHYNFKICSAFSKLPHYLVNYATVNRRIINQNLDLF